MSIHVMLSGIIKNRRIEKNLSTLELSVRTRLDPSLISRYENGNRIPTREHVLRLAEALAIEERKLLVAWLAEKLKKVLSEEELEEVKELAIDRLLGKNDESGPERNTGNRITESQEAAIKRRLLRFQNLLAVYPERWKKYKEEGILSITRDINHLKGNTWTKDHAAAFLHSGKTISEHDFQSHVLLHTTYILLQKTERLSESQLLQALNQLGGSNLEQVPFPISYAGLISMGSQWHESVRIPGLQDVQRWLALVLMLKNSDFPLSSLPERAAPLSEDEPVLVLAEYFGEWLLRELQQAIDFLES